MKLEEKLTILVNTCDGYSDLWEPFFTLLKKYWDPKDIRIVLNTESKTFSMDGLAVDCVHTPQSKYYGERILHVLSEIRTEYVLLLLDDFFLRQPAQTDKLRQIITWMEADKKIACFNMETIPVYVDWESDRYPGFRRVPPGTQYALNMQAAVWRTGMLKQFWKPQVSPWEWEAYCNLLQYKFPDHKIYCTTEYSHSFLDYGHRQVGDVWAVVRGKWVLEDVQPLFERENISVDLSKRGAYVPGQTTAEREDTRANWYSLLYRSLGVEGILWYLGYKVYYKLCCLAGKECNPDFMLYLGENARKKFLRESR